ncbi:filamentous hemagglutinin N-terminal domain-containing protein [Nostoc sp. LEGE 12447]|uniref:two-partner secretion domain-containing protein n=1 Tax=Nostoc sp. LEGE 12447 TaxID=1828640 RepID=UPI001884037C|nr:filamentous hemagglutinin N-terminal domain-containing protein [Nostoc sp. LEGE 12447]MBE9000496.1 filamentous hemagglutinin N-terminal domain-containing protein [Nostoc sp. LEGE 12447]
MSNLWVWFKSLGFAVCSAIAFYENSVIAQQIIPDSTLTTNSQVQTQGNITIIEGGTRAGNNLFHSFEQFSIPTGITADFQNPTDIQNIVSRVTGKSISNIDGILKTNGTANIFLINPNGIIFGPNASLNIGGSFVASTASSLNFADGTKFSATDPRTIPLLTVSVPIGLQFGATAAPIRNQSQAKSSESTITNILNQPVGLQVKLGKTLALVGGDITLEGGNLTAASGQIELGSVAASSIVNLNQTNQGWSLGYQDVQNFQNIRLIQRTIDGSEIPSTVDASGNGGGGNIQLQSRTVELAGNLVVLTTQTTGAEKGGDLTINTKKLVVRDGAQVFTSTTGKGNGGNLTVNAYESVEVIGSGRYPNTDWAQPSLLSTSTGTDGKAGDMTINTQRLRIQDGAKVTTESNGIFQLGQEGFQLVAAKGNGGNLTVNASESVDLIGTLESGSPSSLIALTNGSGDAGKITITTGKLIVQNQAVIAVNSEFSTFTYLGALPNLGQAGELNITAHSILLDEGTLTSNSESGRGGDISLQVRDLLLMRRNSQISTNAGGDKTGGNITIKASNGFLVATPFGNNDITANGFSGSGGKITITAKNIFGFVRRTGADVDRLDPTGERNPNNLRTSDITAFSRQDPTLNGTVQINSPDADPSKGLVELPVNLVDASEQIAAGCNSGAKIGRSSFIATGRGGLVADPTQPLIADDAVLADWITLEPESKNSAAGIQKRAVLQAQQNIEEKSQKVNSVNEPTQIVEAQGWVMDADGNVVLVAQVPTASPHNSSLTATSCAAR